jgi:hypothetical protein
MSWHKFVEKTLTRKQLKLSQTTQYDQHMMRRFTLQLDTAIIFEIVCRPVGSCSAYKGFAGCADIVTFTFLTQGSAATTSFAFCSNCHMHI